MERGHKLTKCVPYYYIETMIK